MATFSLCWDCANAIGGCAWSKKLHPIKDWVATEIKPTSTKPYVTYMVHQCPEFIRDAYNGGASKKPPKEISL